MTQSHATQVAAHEGMLIDALCDAFESGLKQQAALRIEDLLGQLTEGLRSTAFRDLLAVEVELRRGRGEAICAADYHRRFPEYEQIINSICIASDEPLATRTFRRDIQPLASEQDTWSRDASDTGRGWLAVRCPSCRAPSQVAVDSALTDLTCSACGSQFSLVNDRDAGEMQPLTTMGRFELLSRLGMGAFGSVWKARDRDLDRIVAIKIPRRGSMTAEEQEKFFREARAAAQLRHPNIVSVHEIGRDGDNVYIVSDFVAGTTLGDWFTGQKLTSREAAKLCAKIAIALHHAHEQGIVHRDLKPANIMIDGAGEPHVMDFGLARREVGEVTVTLAGHILGTPAYMSPEQAQGDSHQADRRSDVYSLGVILFQLLTSELPFRGNVRMVMQQVIHDDPPSPRKLNGNVPKDLETITLKCLEKQPGRRYPSAGELAAELERFLADRPIQARPVSRTERTVRLVRRNKMVSAASALAVVALLGGTVASTLFAIDSRRSAVVAQDQTKAAIAAADKEKQAKETAVAREAETAAVLDFVENRIFAAARPKGQDGGLGHDVTLSAAIDAALPYVEASFVKQPLIEARLRQTLGLSYSYLGRPTDAVREAEIAQRLFDSHLDSESPLTLGAKNNLASAYRKAGRLDEALPLHELVYEAMRKQFGDHHPDTLKSATNLASAYGDAGRLKEAIALCRQTLDAKVELLGDDHPDTLVSMNNLASQYWAAGRSNEALALLVNSLTTMRSVFGEDHPDTFLATNNLAEMYRAMGRVDEAIPLFEENLAIRKTKLGDDHPDTFSAMNRLAVAYGDAGKLEQAIGLHEQTLAAKQRKLGRDHPDTLYSQNNLANTLTIAGRLNEAIPLFEETLEVSRSKLGREHPETLKSMTNLAAAYCTAGRVDDGLSLYQQAFDAKQRTLGDDHPETLISLNNLASGFADADRVDEAIPLYERALEIMQKKLGHDHPHTLQTMNNLALAFANVGRLEEALPLLEQSLAEMRRKFGEDHPYTLQAMFNIANVQGSAGRLDQALPLYEQTLAAMQKKLGEKHPLTLRALSAVAVTYAAKGRFADAANLNRQILNINADDVAALNGLSWLLATSPVDEFRNGNEAVQLATKACELTNYKYPALIDTLAAAHAEAGDFEAAVKYSEKAIAMLGDNVDPAMRERFNKSLAGYKAKQPRREAPPQFATVNDAVEKPNDDSAQDK